MIMLYNNSPISFTEIGLLLYLLLCKIKFFDFKPFSKKKAPKLRIIYYNKFHINYLLFYLHTAIARSIIIIAVIIIITFSVKRQDIIRPAPKARQHLPLLEFLCLDIRVTPPKVQ